MTLIPILLLVYWGLWVVTGLVSAFKKKMKAHSIGLIACIVLSAVSIMVLFKCQSTIEIFHPGLMDYSGPVSWAIRNSIWLMPISSISLVLSAFISLVLAVKANTQICFELSHD